MTETVGQILKSEEVKLEGQVQLDAVRPGRAAFHPGQTSGEPTADIVENHPEFAVIEITCCCGARTYLRCEYVGETPALVFDKKTRGNPAEVLEGTGTTEQANE
ncbi:MAG: hypothetical protein ACETVZ_06190 [Phycisphaerae bacterium]